MSRSETGLRTELVEGAEVEDESCLRSGSLLALRIMDRTSTAPQVGVARQSQKLVLISGLHDRAHTHHTYVYTGERILSQTLTEEQL